MFGAKLSWCQIVRCQIVLVPNCPGAKLSTFIILVPNCPLLLSWCQIVCFIILVPNCPVPNCPVPNCPVPNCPTIPVSDKQWSFGRLWHSDTDDQCIQIIEVPCAQCTPCKASVLVTFLVTLWDWTYDYGAVGSLYQCAMQSSLKVWWNSRNWMMNKWKKNWLSILPSLW